MSPTEDDRTVQVSQLLTGVAQAIATVRYCWLVTSEGTGIANARPMGWLPRALEADDWTIRFITDGRSEKAAEIRRAGKATVIFQDAGNAFVTLAGAATLRDEASELRRLWKSAYDAYFPTAQDRANAALIEVDVQHMKLWIRGVGPEPFGLKPTKLERHGHGAWRAVQG